MFATRFVGVGGKERHKEGCLPLQSFGELSIPHAVLQASKPTSVIKSIYLRCRYSLYRFLSPWDYFVFVLKIVFMKHDRIPAYCCSTRGKWGEWKLLQVRQLGDSFVLNLFFRAGLELLFPTTLWFSTEHLQQINIELTSGSHSSLSACVRLPAIKQILCSEDCLAPKKRTKKETDSCWLGAK